MLLKKLKSLFCSGSFLRNLTVVMSGTAGAQVIGFLLMPIISRLYSSGDYGIYGGVSAILSMVGACATLQYDQAIVLQKKDSDAFNLLGLACICVAVFSICVGMIFTLCPYFGQRVVKIDSRWLGAALTVAACANGFNLVFQAWCIRTQAFRRISISHILKTLSSSGTWALLGFLGADAWGLIAGLVIGSILSLINLSIIVRRDMQIWGEELALSRMKVIGREYKDFPLYSAPQKLLNATSAGVPVLLLTYFYGIHVAGAYAFGQKALGVPMNVIRTALRQVLFQRASEVHNKGEDLRRLYLMSTGGLAALVFVPVILLFFWVPHIFIFVFGEEWKLAGEYARWLFLWMGVGFCNVPAVLFARILRKQAQLLVYECVVLALRGVIPGACGVFLSAEIAVISFSLLGVLVGLGFMLWVGMLVFAEEQ